MGHFYHNGTYGTNPQPPIEPGVCWYDTLAKPWRPATLTPGPARQTRALQSMSTPGRGQGTLFLLRFADFAEIIRQLRLQIEHVLPLLQFQRDPIGGAFHFYAGQQLADADVQILDQL